MVDFQKLLLKISCAKFLRLKILLKSLVQMGDFQNFSKCKVFVLIFCANLFVQIDNFQKLVDIENISSVYVSNPKIFTCKIFT